MSRWWSGPLAPLGAALAGGAGAAAVMLALAPGSSGGAGVRDYILAHPELIPEAMDRLQNNQNAALVAANAEQIRVPFAGAQAGNRQGDVTVTEYYDYACGYCRQSVGDLDRLVAADPGVRVVYKEMPVLSPLSDRAARVSLAAAKAGRFAAFHHTLFSAGMLDDSSLARAAAVAGVDPAAADGADIAREVEASLATARALRFSGTPVFVVGDKVLPGAVGYAAIKTAVDEARAARPLSPRT